MQWKPDANLPVLGPKYLAAVDRLEASRGTLNSIVRDKLEALYDDELFERFDGNAKALDDQTGEWMSGWRRDSDRLLRGLRAFHAAGLGKPDYLADYDHWARAAFFELGEVLFLSVGLEPHDDLIKEMAATPQRETYPHPEAVFLERRADQLARQFDPNGFSKRTTPDLLLVWITKVKLEVHPDFEAMLETMVERDADAAPPDELGLGKDPNPDKPMEGRELATVLKLLTAIAIHEFGYDPTERRSPIPNEIQDMCDQLGLPISADTIRKYLQTGARFLPQDWKPDK